MSRFPIAKAYDLADEWNKLHPVGTPVLYEACGQWSGPQIERTRTPAKVLYNDYPVVWVTNHHGAAPLCRLTPLLPYECKTRQRPSERCAEAFGILLHEKSIEFVTRPANIVAC
jgi:hypothetical protein